MKKAIILLFILSSCTEPAADRDYEAVMQKETPKVDLTKWQYWIENDEMTEEKSQFAEVMSLNYAVFKFPYEGGSHMFVTLRNKNGKKEVILRIDKGQFVSPFNNDFIKLKFDEEKPINVTYNPAADGSSDIVFLNSSKRIIEKLKKAKILKVQAMFYDEGNVTFNFNVEGLSVK
jgi:hypothetical protein